MNVRRFLLVAASIAVLSGGLLIGNPARAQAPATDESDEMVEQISLFDSLETSTTPSSQSNVARSTMTVSELRQARALYRANQRVARFEYNLWMGHEPLRPRWNAVPMMSSRYTNRKLYVPVYVQPR